MFGIVVIAIISMVQKVQKRSDKNYPMVMDCMICREMFGSGQLTGRVALFQSQVQTRIVRIQAHLELDEVVTGMNT